MARRKKELTVASPAAAPPGAVLSGRILSVLARGLFRKPEKYRPSPQEIVDYYLTPRERKVAYLAALGFTDVEIADALGMTFQTARVHLRSVLTKMQVDDARELCDYFMERARFDSNPD